MTNLIIDTAPSIFCPLCGQPCRGAIKNDLRRYGGDLRVAARGCGDDDAEPYRPPLDDVNEAAIHAEALRDP